MVEVVAAVDVVSSGKVVAVVVVEVVAAVDVVSSGKVVAVVVVEVRNNAEVVDKACKDDVDFVAKYKRSACC